MNQERSTPTGQPVPSADRSSIPSRPADRSTTADKVAAAAGAAWTALLLPVLLLLVGTLSMYVLLALKPGWVLVAWGGGEMDWPTVHLIILVFLGLIKLIVFVWLALCIFLSVWARRLRREE